MEYVIGIALFTAAFLLVAAARRFYARNDIPRWASGFGSGELAALVVTMLIAGGVSAFVSRGFSDLHNGHYVGLVLAGAGVVATAYAIAFLFKGRQTAITAMVIEGARVDGISVLAAGEPGAPANANRKPKRAGKKSAA